MHGSENGLSDEMASGYFQKPDARPRPVIGFKASHALKDKLDAIQSLWQIRTEVEGAAAVAALPPGKEREELKAAVQKDRDAIDFTYVCVRLMSLAADEALTEMLKGLGLDHPPATDEETAQVRAAFLKSARK